MNSILWRLSNIEAFSFRYAICCFLISCLALLSACGGGGSGGGKDDDYALKLTSRVPNAVLQYEEDGYVGQHSITVDISGESKERYYIAVGYDGNGLDDDIHIEDGGNNVAHIYIKAKNGLTPGEYSGSLSVLACADADCNKTLSSPLIIPYLVNVRPILKVNSLSLNVSTQFSSVVAPQRINVQLPAGVDSYTLESSEKWVQITNKTASSFDLVFNVMPVGLHQAAINVNSGGKSLTVAIKYTVAAFELPTSQEPLLIQDGAYDWTDYQGGATHNGFVPITVDTSKFSKRWEWPSDNTINSGLASPAIYNNRVYLSYNYSGFSSMLVALNEDDGNIDWYAELVRDPLNVTSPVVGATGVYVKTTKASGDLFHAFNTITGDRLFEKPYGRSANSLEIPPYSIQDSSLYLANDYDARDLVKINPENGQENWTTENLQLSASSPVVIGNYVYLISHGSLYKYEKNSGIWLSEKNIGFGTGETKSVPVVIDNSGMLVLSGKASFDSQNDRTLAYVNADNLEINWSIQGAYISEPVVGRGVLYILNRAPLQLEARNILDGTLLWTWAPDGKVEDRFLGNILLTNNLLFLSTNTLTHAINLETHKTSWAYPKPSVNRALSRNGVLYLITADNVINPNPLYMKLVVLNTK